MERVEPHSKHNPYPSYSNTTLRPQSSMEYNRHSSSNQPPSRKRRLVDPNQNIYPHNSCSRGRPAAKRARYNHYNNTHTNAQSTYNRHNSRQSQPDTNQNTKFRQRPNYPPNANHINHTNHLQRNSHMKPPKKKEIEQDFHRITQRMRQIDIGKATTEYKNYIALVPKDKRKPGHPRTPNPRYKMPNKHWKTAVNRWRKGLHVFDDMGTGNKDTSQKEKSVEPKDKKSDGKFCCEKCCKEFVKFDEWQNHREKCNGKRSEKSACKQKENVKPKEDHDESKDKEEETDEDDDLDLFKLDGDIDLNFMESTNNVKEEKKEATLLMALNDVLNEDDDDLF